MEEMLGGFPLSYLFVCLFVSLFIFMCVFNHHQRMIWWEFPQLVRIVCVHLYLYIIEIRG